MKQARPSKRAIKENLKELRLLIDGGAPNPQTARIAYAMECAIRWATEETTWAKNRYSQAFEAVEQALCLDKDICL